MHDIVIFGATGFTGQLVVRALHTALAQAHSSLTVAIAGRSQVKLDAVKERVGAASFDVRPPFPSSTLSPTTAPWSNCTLCAWSYYCFQYSERIAVKLDINDTITEWNAQQYCNSQLLPLQALHNIANLPRHQVLHLASWTILLLS